MTEDCVNWLTEGGVSGLVSVIIPAYNRERLIVSALDSIKKQSYRPIEIIVVDDGSTDRTVRLIEKWRSQSTTEDLRLHLEIIEHSGAPKARNTGLRISKGEFIQYMDSDDLLVASKIQSQAQALRDFPTVLFAWSRLISAKPDQAEGLVECLARKRSRFRKSSVSATPLLIQQGLLRRNACRIIGPWNEELIKNQDWEYSVRYVALSVRGVESSDIGYIWVKHDGQRIGGDWRGRWEKLVSCILMAADSAALATGETRPLAASEKIAKNYSIAMMILLSNGDTVRAAILRGRIRSVLPFYNWVRLKNEVVFMLSMLIGSSVANYMSRN